MDACDDGSGVADWDVAGEEFVGELKVQKLNKIRAAGEEKKTDADLKIGHYGWCLIWGVADRGVAEDLRCGMVRENGSEPQMDSRII